MTKKTLEKHTHNTIISIPAGIDIKKKSNSELQITNTLFFLGSLDWIPNQKALKWFVKEVWPAIYIKNPQCEFHVAGRNCPPEFEHMFLAKGIYFHGEVESAEKFITTHDIMILPLFAGSGLRIRLLEGMMFEKPIVTTSMGAKGLDIKNGIELLLAESVADFEAAINKLLSNSLYKEEIARNAGAFVREKYNNDKLIKKALACMGK
jgi:glycosyltransferase involved in cell wall biosynthesis